MRLRARERPVSPALDEAAAGTSRPVLLATLGVPFDPRATELAVDAAVEAGQPLIVANVVEMEPVPMSVMLGYDQVGDPTEGTARHVAELANSLGVAVEWLRVRSPHPLDALLELVSERRPGLLVFGPDRSRVRARRYRRAAQRVRDRAACLVWLPE
jgi:nucleotide-binding universal stress UspA family protein